MVKASQAGEAVAAPRAKEEGAGSVAENVAQDPYLRKNSVLLSKLRW